VVDTAVNTADWQDRLESALSTLEAEADAACLQELDVAALNYVACGAGLARSLLVILDESSRGLELLAPSQHSALEDVAVVRSSALEAIQQLSQVLREVRDWVSQPEISHSATLDGIRHVFHSLSNLLVSINCYSELLLVELPDDCLAHAQIKSLSVAGTRASRVAHARALLQRLVNERQELASEARASKEREILAVLITALCADAGSTGMQEWRRNPEIIDVARESLPALEGRVLSEAVRRLEAVVA